MFEDALGSKAPRPAVTGLDRYHPGDVIDRRFVVVAKLGAGGMGTVLKVLDRSAEKERALKFCHQAGDERKRFKREVKIMQQVSHDHVVPVAFANLDHDPPFFVMPLAIGCLDDEIATLRRDETAALAAFKEACLGIAALHASGAVHRDLKPKNLLRFRFGQRDSWVAVSDLGLAKLEYGDSTALTETTDKLGTWEYAAPEQFELGGTRDSDARTDIFQLGRLLYHFVTGRTPMALELSLLPRGLDHIVRKATNLLPNNRYQSVGQLLDALSYYEASKRETDSAAAYENLAQEAEALLVDNQIDPVNLQRLLEILASLEPTDYSRIIADFDRIPTDLLKFIARDFDAELLPGLTLYREAIRVKVAGRAFSYADTIAARMSELFTQSGSPEVQTMALQVLLVAADILHRYNAMGIFARLLWSIKDVGVALPVADMIREEAEHYRVVAKTIAAESLHPAILAAHQEVMKPRPQVDQDEDDDDYIPF
ncbi:serine/threonine-protein kinase [Tundrisphaera sp. TA3]|uniref:serine/threonine-protein kinase n=1 Tax=Tundrisphaera sp. TA3 TaxID=3435775 RepID=UPI003EBECB48